MTYTPYVWHDGATGGTLVDAAHLNRIEQGLGGAAAAAAAADSGVRDRTDPNLAGYPGDWNSLTTSGIWRISGNDPNTNMPAGAYNFGTLIVFGAVGGNVVQLYIADQAPSRVFVRNQWAATNGWEGWALLNNPDIWVGGGVAVAGWTVNRFDLRRVGPVVHADISLTRTGGTITGTADGNITNVQVGNVGSWVPVTAWAGLAPGPGGPVTSMAVDSAGRLFLCAMPANYSLVNGQEITAGGSWVTTA